MVYDYLPKLSCTVPPTLLKTLRLHGNGCSGIFVFFCFRAYSCKQTVKTKVLPFHLCKCGLTTYPRANIFPFPVPHVLK